MARVDLPLHKCVLRGPKCLPGRPPDAILLVVREQIVQSTYSPKRRRASGPELGAWRAFLRAGTTSALALEAALADTGVSHSEYDVLVNVATGPRDGLRPTELAERVLITKSGLTRLLDRLVERGYIERRACASDRRGQLIVLTSDGRRAFRRAAPNVVRAIGTIFGEGFTERDVMALRVACERIATAAESMTA
ncbi:MAG TPA: MarR family transcriptional regulator [Chloroflexi bacterium]|nr:MarR family transcriptional regulator [Chloroflexota bacterium]HAL27838.1 MarR family transcriptional regulator [Chloroflexota bacterium]